MVVASGIVEIEDLGFLHNIRVEIINHGMKISEIDGLDILFLVERKNIDEVKREIKSVKRIAGVKHVHISYYSMEGMDEDS